MLMNVGHLWWEPKLIAMRILLASLIIICSSTVFGQAQLILDVFPPTCEGCCDGAVNLSIDGCAAGLYDVAWTGPAVSSGDQDLSDICESGVYYVAVTDANGYVMEATFN